MTIFNLGDKFWEMFITFYHKVLLFVKSNHIPASSLLSNHIPVAYPLILDSKYSDWILAKELFNVWDTSKS